MLEKGDERTTLREGVGNLISDEETNRILPILENVAKYVSHLKEKI